MRIALLTLVAVVQGCAVEDVEEPGVGALESLSQLPPCTGDQWCIEAAPIPGVLLHAVSAVNADDVFAVGDNGAIWRRQNNHEWTAMNSGITTHLRSVWAVSSTDVWAGGPAVLLHYDGTAWTRITAITMSQIDSIWASSSDNVWFAGSGTIARWNGSGFTTWGFGGTLLSISGTGPSDVWATGEATNLRRFNGSTWTTVNPGAGTSTFFAVLARAPNDVWAADFMPNRETARYNGSRWVIQRTGAVFQSMSAFNANDVWGAGSNKVGHWNGTAWTSAQPFGSNVTLWSVTTAPGHAWVVGGNSLIAHRTF